MFFVYACSPCLLFSDWEILVGLSKTADQEKKKTLTGFLSSDNTYKVAYQTCNLFILIELQVTWTKSLRTNNSSSHPNDSYPECMINVTVSRCLNKACVSGCTVSDVSYHLSRLVLLFWLDLACYSFVLGNIRSSSTGCLYEPVYWLFFSFVFVLYNAVS